MNSVIYSEKAQQLIATSAKDSAEEGSFDVGGFATMTTEGDWVLAQLHSNPGGCASQAQKVGLFSKPIIARDATGQEHFIATPLYPDGCAYWSTDAVNWYASDSLWN